MLDFEQQANQAQALASLDDDWHLLEGERTTFAIFLSPFRAPSLEGDPGRAMPRRSKFKSDREGRDGALGVVFGGPLPSNKFEETAPHRSEYDTKSQRYAMKNFIYI